MTEAGVAAILDRANASLPGGGAAKRAFYSARKDVWRVAETDENPAGYARCAEPRAGDGGGPRSRFCYIVVRNAGHEAVSYAPRAMYDLNERLIARLPFGRAEGNEARDALDRRHTPTCAPCGGAPPLAGDALPDCVH